MESAAAQITVVLATLAAVAACVLLQYEALIFLWRRLSAHGGHRRAKVLHAVASLLLLHAVEISIFGVALWLLALWPACGGLAGLVLIAWSASFTYLEMEKAWAGRG